MICLGLILGACLIWILQCSLYRHFWQRGLNATVSFCEEEVTEGDTASLDEVITNAKYLPLPALHVKFQMGKDLVFLNQENSTITDQNYRSDIFSCMPWQKIIRHLEFQCRKRGLYAIRQLDLVSYDFLWSSQFFTSLPAETYLYVYPSFVDPVRLELPLRQLSGTMAIQNALIRDPFDLQNIRDYTRHDPYRDVNWKATAHTGSLKVNVHTPAASWQVTLILDGDADRLWADLDLKEETIRLAATLTDLLIARETPVSIRSNARDCFTQHELNLRHGAGKDHLRAALQILARADLEGTNRRPAEQLIDELIEKHQRADGQNTTVYLLLSPCQRESLAEKYAELTALSPGSQWILPIRPDDELRLDPAVYGLSEGFYPWEIR